MFNDLSSKNIHDKENDTCLKENNDSAIKHASAKCNLATDEDLQLLACNNYSKDAGCPVDKNFIVSDSLTSTTSDNKLLHTLSNVLWTKLNQQCSTNSYLCDLSFKVIGSEEKEPLSAHSCVLVALLGSKFENKLNLLLSQSDQNDNKFTESQHCSGILDRNRNHTFILPAGFENIVYYCYNKSYHPSLSDLSSILNTKTLINEMVDESCIKYYMLEDLQKLIPQDIVNESQHRISPATIVEVSHGKMEEFKVPQEENNPVKLSDNKNDEVKVTVPHANECFWTTDEVSSDDEYNPSESDCGVSGDEDVNIEITTSDNPAQLSSQSKSPKLNCDYQHNQEVSSSKQSRPTRSTRSKISNFYHIDINEGNTQSKKRLKTSKRDFKKQHKAIGKCCEELFSSKFKLGLHVLHAHCRVYATCSECKSLVLMNELVSHYQSEHKFGNFMEKHVFNEGNERQQGKTSHQLDKSKKNVCHHTTNENSYETLLSVDTSDSFSINSSNELNDCTLTNMSKMIQNSSCDNDRSHAYLKSDENISADITEDFFETAVEVKTHSEHWQKETICVACGVTMTVTNYIQHLNEQLKIAMFSLHCKSSSLHQVHRCLLFQCCICENSKPIRLYLFLKKHVERYHLIESAGDEKETCDICGVTMLRYYLQKHKKCHQQPNSNKKQKVTCEICGKVITKKRISVHRRSHFEKFSCTQCSKVFNRKENLRVHMRIHTGEKPYVCDICGKGFRQYVELKLHNRKHEKERMLSQQNPETSNQTGIIQVPLVQHPVTNNGTIRTVFDDEYEYELV